MPWVIKKQGGKYCVYREGANGRATGRSRGCHDTRAQAIQQQRALYRNAPEASAQEVTVAAMDTTAGNTTYWFLPGANNNTWTSTLGTFQVAVADTADAEQARGAAFEGVLAVIGAPSSDGRYLIPNEISHRDLPRPLMVQTATEHGHAGAESCGRIDSIEYIPITDFERRNEFSLADMRDEAVVVWASGTFDDSEFAKSAERIIENGAGVSIDLPPDRIAAFDPETFEEIPEEEIDFQSLMEGSYLVGIGGKIAAATVVSIPAFEEASIVLVPGHALVASAYGLKLKSPEVLTAAAAGAAPLRPPRDWFFTEEPAQPVPLTVTDEGQVYGHLALWDQCHVGGMGCDRAPRSFSDYAYFHLGEIETDEGAIAVGRITVGKEGQARGGHASVVLGRQGAIDHYDQTGCVAAFVRARDGNLGIWLSGAIRSDVPAEKIRDLRANPPSGDWRDNELVGVLSVPVPGFPIPRIEALVATGASGDEETKVLIASGYSTEYEIPESLDVPTYRRRMLELSSRRKEVEEAAWERSLWYFKDYSPEQRRRMAKSGSAMPDGSFPIADCEDAMNARRSVGRAPASKRPAVERHIARRERTLGCAKK